MKNLLLFSLLAIVTSIIGCSTSKTLPLKPPKHGGVYVVAHRGAHLNIPENTIPAYQKAIDLGVDFVEIDVRMTKDHHFVSCHNQDANQYTVGDTPEKISEMTLAEVRSLDVGSRIGPQWAGTQIPTFEEILDLVKGKCGIYLDLKNAPVAPLIEMIKERGMENDVIWYAYSDSDFIDIKKICPECIIMPDPGPEKNLSGLIEKFHPDVIASTWEYLSASFVKTCHKANAIVIVDDDGPKTWDDILKWGTDGIQTNEPEKLIARLEKR
ncbi:MAG: hypothetical protein GWP06_13350 [Actinobacteria bacterium]|nr:hypothetical protein [Actinomycetota bacterium]